MSERRSLSHNLAHTGQPQSPPTPPSPPSLPPSAPPPPPLPFVFPFQPVMIFLIIVSILCCIGFAAKAIKKRKAGKGKDVEGKGGDGDGDGDGNPEVGPESVPPKLAKSFRARGCTDVLCLLLFLLFWLGLVYVFYLGLTVGDPWSVPYGKDYLGHRCGRGNFSDRPKTLYPRIDKDVMEQSAIATTAPWKLVFYGLCVAECPHIDDPTVCFSEPDRCLEYDYGTEEQWSAAGGSKFYYSVMPTISIVNRCIPIKYTAESGEKQRCAYPLCGTSRIRFPRALSLSLSLSLLSLSLSALSLFLSLCVLFLCSLAVDGSVTSLPGHRSPASSRHWPRGGSRRRRAAMAPPPPYLPRWR